METNVHNPDRQLFVMFPDESHELLDVADEFGEYDAWCRSHLYRMYMLGRTSGKPHTQALREAVRQADIYMVNL